MILTRIITTLRTKERRPPLRATDHPPRSAPRPAPPAWPGKALLRRRIPRTPFPQNPRIPRKIRRVRGGGQHKRPVEISTRTNRASSRRRSRVRPSRGRHEATARAAAVRILGKQQSRSLETGDTSALIIWSGQSVPAPASHSIAQNEIVCGRW